MGIRGKVIDLFTREPEDWFQACLLVVWTPLVAPLATVMIAFFGYLGFAMGPLLAALAMKLGLLEEPVEGTVVIIGSIAFGIGFAIIVLRSLSRTPPGRRVKHWLNVAAAAPVGALAIVVALPPRQLPPELWYVATVLTGACWASRVQYSLRFKQAVCEAWW
jgi:hypothetical protein